MAFNSNTTYGTTVYSTGTFFDNAKIVANDGSSLSSNTLATQSGLTIDVGGYERLKDNDRKPGTKSVNMPPYCCDYPYEKR